VVLRPINDTLTNNAIAGVTAIRRAFPFPSYGPAFRLRL
jgi:hypothetical protein